MISESEVVCHQLKQVLKKIVTDDQFDKYYTEMLNLKKSQDTILTFFTDLCSTFSIQEDQSSSYCFIVKHILDNNLIKSCENEEIQTESEIKIQIENDNRNKEAEKIQLDEEIKQLYKSYEQTKKERDQILQEFKINESTWSKLPHKIEKKKFRLYSDLLYVIEDLQRSINKL